MRYLILKFQKAQTWFHLMNFDRTLPLIKDNPIPERHYYKRDSYEKTYIAKKNCPYSFILFHLYKHCFFNGSKACEF